MNVVKVKDVKVKNALVQLCVCTTAAVTGSLLLHFVYHIHIHGLRWWQLDPGIVCALIGWFAALSYSIWQLKVWRNQSYAQWKRDIIDAMRRGGQGGEIS